MWESGTTGREVKKREAKQKNCEWREETGSTGSGRIRSMRLKKQKQKQNSDKKLKSVTIEETEMSRKYAGR